MPAGHISASVLREEARLLAQNPRMIVVPQPVLTDWSRVRGLRRGTEILLTLSDAPRARRYLFDVSDAELMVMKVTEPSLPPAVRAALTRVAQHPDKFGTAIDGRPALQLDDLRVNTEGVWFGGRRVADLDDVYERVARERVVEVRQASGGGGTGAAWGLLVGGAIGLGNMLIKCGVNWRQENESCSNLEGAGLVIFPLFGALIGGVAGVASGPVTIYRLPPPEPARPTAVPSATPPAPTAPAVTMPSPLSSWSTLGSRVQSGDPILVEENSGAIIKGALSRVSESSLRIVVGDVMREIPAGAVARIDVLAGGNKAARGFLIGAAIGAAFGAISCAGSSSTDQSWNRDRQSNACGSSIAGSVAFLGGIGALIGARSQGSRAVPVYRAASRTLTVSPTIGPRSMGAMVAAHF